MLKVVRERTSQEGGFTIVESMVGLMLIMSVLVGSLAMMGTSVKGIVTSRQRSVATSLAREVIERARATTYGSVGHDLDDDAGLNASADPNLSGSALTFEGRLLAASDTNKDGTSPFYPHRRSEVIGGTTYTTRAYVTGEVPLAGDAYKRVTVIVRWSNPQHGGAVKDTVRVETQIFDALRPPDPLLLGEAEVDAGSVRILDSPAPLLGDDRLLSATLFLPFARGQVESRFVRSVRSSARSARTELRIAQDSGLAAEAPCTKTSGVSPAIAECPGTASDLIADNDAGTAPIADPAPLQSTVDGGTTARGNGSIALALGGSNTTRSLATAASTVVGNADDLPYVKTTASGPGSYAMPFDFGPARGSLATFSAPVAAEAVSDRAGVGVASTVSSEVKVAHPALELLTFTSPPMAGYAGMVRASATSIAMSTAAGPSAPAPTFSASPMTISLFGTHPTTGAGSYRSVSITPGSAAAETSTAAFVVDGQPVAVTVTLTATPRLVSSQVVSSSTLVSSSRLSSWLKIRLDVTAGSTNQLSYEVDYGRLVADSRYEEPS
ncbi:MAG: hypothetical protein M3503_02545 [Actinomycetota bacterium]|nr:hypothetical protein [Actinomycetota bacterium]